MNQPVDSLQIENEIDALRQRLQEAEDLREAISQGQVDAFVVGPSDHWSGASDQRGPTQVLDSFRCPTLMCM